MLYTYMCGCVKIELIVLLNAINVDCFYEDIVILGNASVFKITSDMFSYDIHYPIKFLFVCFRYGHKKYRTDLHMAFLSSTLEYS